MPENRAGAYRQSGQEEFGDLTNVISHSIA
jgi:hypothetical protein